MGIRVIFWFHRGIRIAFSGAMLLMAGLLVTPRRYICSAKYITGSDTRYLLREVITPKIGDDLREAVVELFVSDLMRPTETLRTQGQAEAKRKEMSRVYMPGKLTDLTIDELKDSKIPIKKEAN